MTPRTYTSSDAALATSSVVIVEFTLACKNDVIGINLYAALNGKTIPAVKTKDGGYQVSLVEVRHKTLKCPSLSLSAFAGNLWRFTNINIYKSVRSCSYFPKSYNAAISTIVRNMPIFPRAFTRWAFTTKTATPPCGRRSVAAAKKAALKTPLRSSRWRRCPSPMVASGRALLSSQSWSPFVSQPSSSIWPMPQNRIYKTPLEVDKGTREWKNVGGMTKLTQLTLLIIYSRHLSLANLNGVCLLNIRWKERGVASKNWFILVRAIKATF